MEMMRGASVPMVAGSSNKATGLMRSIEVGYLGRQHGSIRNQDTVYSNTRATGVERKIRIVKILEGMRVPVGVGSQHNGRHLGRRPRNHSAMPLARCKRASDMADEFSGT